MNLIKDIVAFILCCIVSLTIFCVVVIVTCIGMALPFLLLAGAAAIVWHVAKLLF